MVSKLAEQLRSILKPPVWSGIVKTGHAKERPPADSGWWYERGASVLRKVKALGPVGVSKLRTKYGSKKNRGVKPERFYKASGNILRKILQQLESAKLIKQVKISTHRGRIVTKQGNELLKNES